MHDCLFDHTQAPIHQHIPTIRYAIDPTANLILEEWVGEITREELRVHWTAFLNNPDVLNCRRTIVDLTRANLVFNGSDLYSLVEHLIKPKIGDTKWITAIIVESPLQFGVSRQYAAYADHYSDDMIFTSYAKAKSWIDAKVHTE